MLKSALLNKKVLLLQLRMAIRLAQKCENRSRNGCLPDSLVLLVSDFFLIFVQEHSIELTKEELRKC